MEQYAQWLLTALLLGSTSCAHRAEETGPLPLRTIAKGSFSGIQKPTRYVLKSQQEWQKTWAEHASKESPPPALPEVDFEKEYVVVATLGQRSTGGHAITIKKAEIQEGDLKILIELRSPGPGSMTLQAVTAPFHFAAIPAAPFRKAQFEQLDPKGSSSKPDSSP